MEPYPYNLGSHSRDVMTHSPDAQAWFNRGLTWTYGFNHEEAAACFKKALELDTNCAMAYWGLAYVKGPFINKTWDLFADQEREVSLLECHTLSLMAFDLADKERPENQALIEALVKRYCHAKVDSLHELYLCNDNFAEAMRQAHATYPSDLDITALFAEAMMLRTPWRLWDIEKGIPCNGTDTLEIIEVLEAGLKQDAHAGVLHMYIHAIEMSPFPEKALAAADQLRHLCPDVGHLRHMPAHIDILCGNYAAAVEAGISSTNADKKYLDSVGPYNFYATACCHDYHLMMFAGMFMGHFESAQKAAKGIEAIVTADVLKNAATPYLYLTLENYLSMNMHVLVRFGKWDEIIASSPPSDPELFRLSTAMYYYALAVAHAAKGNITNAQTARQAFETACQAISPTRHLFNNTALAVLAIARAMLKGELEYRKGNFESAFDHLRTAVELNDSLAYTEPWAWMHPPRHALAALLLEQGQVEEAEQVCKADLGLDEMLSRACWHPNNVWMLHAYAECLERLAKHNELAVIKLQLKLVKARADVPIESSCCCRHQGKIGTAESTLTSDKECCGR